MRKNRRILKRSANGRFFLFLEKPIYRNIDLDKKTSLWVSSDYLVKESIKQNRDLALSQIEKMIDWNTKNERYEMCSKLLDLKEKYFNSGRKNIKP